MGRRYGDTREEEFEEDNRRKIRTATILNIITIIVIVSLSVVAVAVSTENTNRMRASKNDTSLDTTARSLIDTNEDKVPSTYESVDYYKVAVDNIYLDSDLEPSVNSNTLKISPEFTRALYGTQGIAYKPQAIVLHKRDNLLSSSGSVAEKLYITIKDATISKNYLTYYYETREDALNATGYADIHSYYSIKQYKSETQQVINELNLGINIEDCYIGVPICINLDENFEFIYPVLGIKVGKNEQSVEGSGSNEDESSKKYNTSLNLLGFISEASFLNVETESLIEYNNSNKILTSVDYSMTPYLIGYNEDENLIYLENIDTEGDYSIRLDPTYPWPRGFVEADSTY